MCCVLALTRGSYLVFGRMDWVERKRQYKKLQHEMFAEDHLSGLSHVVQRLTHPQRETEGDGRTLVMLSMSSLLCFST